jgi:hypothetical protein
MAAGASEASGAFAASAISRIVMRGHPPPWQTEKTLRCFHRVANWPIASLPGG